MKHNDSFTKEDLKRIFRGYTTLTKKMEKELRYYGFKVERTSRHIILSYFDGIQKYQFVMAATGSDWRSGYNLVSCIWNTLQKNAVYAA